jgi:N-acetylmuramoyl-L-alanine amidase
MKFKFKEYFKKIKLNKQWLKFSFAFVVFFVFCFSCVLVSGNVSLDIISVSASMTQTRIIQAKLSELGYYEESIDGVYDQATKQAVTSFQTDQGITATGVVDSITAAALGVSTSTQTNSDLYLLAKLVYAEARGEPYTGQVAVAAVVLNRVDSASFPNTIQGVIYEPWAFSCLYDGQFNLEPNSTSYQAAQDAMNGWDPSYGCLFYYNPTTATSSWIFTRTTVVTIGSHVFAI